MALYAVLYFLAAHLTDELSSPRALRFAAQALQASGVLALGVLWHLVGGVDNPAFLLAFVLPVILVVVVAMLATWIPARRALRVNPASLLKAT